jgi:hypothetical protein
LEEPLLLEINAKHVPNAWTRIPLVQGIADALRTVGAKSNLPLYLLPGLRQELATVPVKPDVKTKRGLEVKERDPGVWLLRPTEKEETSLGISGEVPAGVKAGDVLLVDGPHIRGSKAGRHGRLSSWSSSM